MDFAFVHLLADQEYELVSMLSYCSYLPVYCNSSSSMCDILLLFVVLFVSASPNHCCFVSFFSHSPFSMLEHSLSPSDVVVPCFRLFSPFPFPSFICIHHLSSLLCIHLPHVLNIYNTHNKVGYFHTPQAAKFLLYHPHFLS